MYLGSHVCMRVCMHICICMHVCIYVYHWCHALAPKRWLCRRFWKAKNKNKKQKKKRAGDGYLACELRTCMQNVFKFKYNIDLHFVIDSPYRKARRPGWIANRRFSRRFTRCCIPAIHEGLYNFRDLKVKQLIFICLLNLQIWYLSKLWPWRLI